MLIVLTVFGIMAAVAVPTFLKDDPAADVRDAADRLANVLRQARFRAVSMKRPVHVEFEPGGADGFYTAYADDDGDGDVDGSASEVEATRITFPDRSGGLPGVALPDGVRFDRGAATSSPDDDASAPGAAVDVPVNPLVFRPRGTVEWPDGATDPSAGLYLGHAGDPQIVYAVVLMPTGAVKTWRLDDGDWR
jgi:type II secretory pathway pseudopilin PulG